MVSLALTINVDVTHKPLNENRPQPCGRFFDISRRVERPICYTSTMNTVIISFGLALIGLILGSFAGATVWRLRARQLVDDKASGEDYDKKEYKRLLPLTESSVKKDRSRCLSCQHTLGGRDLIPLFSWISTGGTCRYCKVPIGWFEPIMELGTAGLFVGSFLLWPTPLQTPIELVLFMLWIIAAVLLVILFAYDKKWFLLPDRIIWPLVLVGGLSAGFQLLNATDAVQFLFSLIGSVTILSGSYYLLWRLSRGQWVGFGDVKLNLGLALLLADWRLALVAVFMANLLGTLFVLPGLLSGTLSRSSHVPFGPFLITGAIIALLFGRQLFERYLTISL